MIKIEQGKYYRAANGDKVGPMERWTTQDALHPWESAPQSCHYDVGGDIWRTNGTSDYGMPTLVAEWSES